MEVRKNTLPYRELTEKTPYLYSSTYMSKKEKKKRKGKIIHFSVKKLIAH